jgi:VCBS repeat-containing protein
MSSWLRRRLKPITFHDNQYFVVGNHQYPKPGSFPVTVTLRDGPAEGGSTSSATSTGVLFTPAAGFNGAAGFDDTVRDNGTTGGTADPKSATAQVGFTVTPINDPPTAQDDAYVTDAGYALTVDAAHGVLANDTDVDNMPAQLSAQVVAPPAHGSLTLHAAGSFTYTPAASFTGSDTFTYTTSDGTDASAPATVTFTVNPALGSVSVCGAGVAPA